MRRGCSLPALFVGLTTFLHLPGALHASVTEKIAYPATAKEQPEIVEQGKQQVLLALKQRHHGEDTHDKGESSVVFQTDMQRFLGVLSPRLLIGSDDLQVLLGVLKLALIFFVFKLYVQFPRFEFPSLIGGRKVFLECITRHGAARSPRAVCIEAS